MSSQVANLIKICNMHLCLWIPGLDFQSLNGSNNSISSGIFTVFVWPRWCYINWNSFILIFTGTKLVESIMLLILRLMKRRRLDRVLMKVTACHFCKQRRVQSLIQLNNYYSWSIIHCRFISNISIGLRSVLNLNISNILHGMDTRRVITILVKGINFGFSLCLLGHVLFENLFLGVWGLPHNSLVRSNILIQLVGLKAIWSKWPRTWLPID